MGSSRGRAGSVAGIVIALVAVLCVAGFFGVKEFLHRRLDTAPVPIPVSQTTMPTKVKNDPALHKKLYRYVSQFGFVGTFEVTRPTSKSIYMTMHASSKDDAKTSQALINGLACVYVYLKQTHASTSTLITVTITDGNLRAFDMSSLGWKSQLTYKELEAELTAYHEAHPDW
jgi:hypothetical protein